MRSRRVWSRGSAWLAQARVFLRWPPLTYERHPVFRENHATDESRFFENQAAKALGWFSPLLHCGGEPDFGL